MAQVIGEAETFEGRVNSVYNRGYDFKLNENGVCQKTIRYNDFINGGPYKKIKDVELENCKADLIAQKVRETLGGNCTASEDVRHTGLSEGTFLRRAKQETYRKSLSEDCMCERTYSKRSWLSKAEEITIYPVISIVDKSKIRNKSVFTLLERDECASLAKNEEEALAIRAAYDTFR